MFASFFRQITRDTKAEEPEQGCALMWSITDVASKQVMKQSLIDPCAVPFLRERLETATDLDDRLRRSLLEMVQRGVVPLPDKIMEGEIRCDSDRLYLDFDGNKFSKNEDGAYVLSLRNGEGFAAELQFAPEKPYTRNLRDGCIKLPQHGDAMFYYFCPRCTCHGSIAFGGESPVEVVGEAWYDREFGGVSPRCKDATGQDCEANTEGALMEFPHLGWKWLCMQLSDGSELTACIIVDPARQPQDMMLENYAITLSAENVRTVHDMDTGDEPRFLDVPGRSWRSLKTMTEYPTAWTLDCQGVHLEIEAEVEDSEIITLIALPAFWEGRVRARGTVGGQEVTGFGFVELHGLGRQNCADIKYFFNGAGAEMRREMAAHMPLDPSEDELARLLGPDGYAAVSSIPGSFGRDAVVNNLLVPLRDMYDRGGKAWRSCAWSLCVDAVGGNSNKYTHGLPGPEMLHSGSLIIDDIQDKSLTRRGQPCCHLIYGEPIAINAACFSYFTGQTVNDRLEDDMRLQLYDLYFQTMLAGHAGQGADIAGLATIMPAVVETGNSKLATDTIIGIHRLKSGIPVRHMAQGGCIVGRGTERQKQALGDFFEHLGVAFQIIDDVVNLEGFCSDNWKTCGEDVMEGKVTFPIALAMKSLDRDARATLWAQVESKPQDMETVEAVIEACRETNSLAESRLIAVDMVETAWATLSKELPDTIAKMFLHAFSMYVLERHY